MMVPPRNPATNRQTFETTPTTLEHYQTNVWTTKNGSTANGLK